jgi:ubiquinone biosynthesis protein UbiJ
MLLLKPIESALNASLAVDPESQDKLRQFNDRCIRISLTDLKVAVQVSIQDTQLILAEATEHNVDLTIEASSFALLNVAREPDNLFSAEIKILGDVQFAKQLQDWLAGFDFDWEAQLARITGDTLAYPIAQGLRRTMHWLQSSKNSVEQSVAEYLREEARLLPDNTEVAAFMADVDKIRADSDRFEARLNRLLAKQRNPS